MTPYKDAVNDFYKRKWVSHPLTLDDAGLPKKPITTGWTGLTLDAKKIRNLAWDRAAGVGLLLGPPSGNLVALDLDDQEFGAVVVGEMVLHGTKTRTVQTISRRFHILFVERQPTPSTALNVRWQGRAFKVELKAGGTQVVTPPTPGYDLIRDFPPMEVESLQAVWDAIALRFRVEVLGNQRRVRVDTVAVLAGVPEGERDEALFRLACRLRHADVPVEMAEALILQAAGNCSPPFPPRIAVQKVVSAYRYQPGDRNSDTSRSAANDSPIHTVERYRGEVSWA